FIQTSFVASESRATACPPCVWNSSGSRPRLPMRVTLLTIALLLCGAGAGSLWAAPPHHAYSPGVLLTPSPSPSSPDLAIENSLEFPSHARQEGTTEPDPD